MNSILVVAKKELIDNFRDRRSLLLALLFPLFGPLTQAGMFSVSGSKSQEKRDAPLQIVVSGAEHAPALAEHLRSNDITFVETSDAQVAVEKRQADVGLTIPADFANSLLDPRPANLQIVMDDSRRDADRAADRLRRVLDGYGARIASTRLLLRGVDPGLISPLAISEIDISPSSAKAARLLGTMPFFLVMALFLGGFYVAVDTTAGERERQSLEPLLSLPVKRADLAIGKWIATWFFSTLSLVVSLTGFWIIFNQMPTESLGLDVQLSVGQTLRMLAIMLPLACLASSVQMWVACLSRTSKEAQTYIGLLMMVPMAPGMMVAIGALEGIRALLWTPMVGEQLLIDRILHDQPIVIWDHLALVGATMLCALLVGGLVIRRFSTDKMV